jgi:hypothetical protein
MASAPVKAIDQEGGIPFQANVTSLNNKGNCVAVRQGGEQPALNDQSVTKVNLIRPSLSGSQLATSEPLTARRCSLDRRGLPGG